MTEGVGPADVSDLASRGFVFTVSARTPSVGKRPSPCQDFDVRGLSDADRAEFWRAAAAAADSLRARFGDGFAANRASPSSTAIAKLLELKREIDTEADADEFYPFDGRRIDLNDLWEKPD